MSAIATPVGEISRDTADASTDVIFFLDSRLTITHCNPAWDKFARENHGERALAANVVGRRLFDFIAADLQPFYRTVFESCAADNLPFSFDYECSSASVYRLFRMQILPLRQGGGFAVLNAIRVERPQSGRSSKSPGPEYVAEPNTVTLCAHCRRTRRQDDPSRWEWVPAHLDIGELRLNHAVCPPCRSYYYGLAGERLSAGSLLLNNV